MQQPQSPNEHKNFGPTKETDRQWARERER